MVLRIFFFKQKTAYEMRISDWSSDVCSSDLGGCDRRFWGVLLPIPTFVIPDLIRDPLTPPNEKLAPRLPPPSPAPSNAPRTPPHPHHPTPPAAPPCHQPRPLSRPPPLHTPPPPPPAAPRLARPPLLHATNPAVQLK